MFSLKLSDHISDRASSPDKIRSGTTEGLGVEVNIEGILGLIQMAEERVSDVVAV